MSPIVISNDRMQSLNDELSKFLREWHEPTPEFKFELGWAGDYDSLFRGRVEKTSTDEILIKVAKTGRALISARGGAAKTTIVYRVARTLLKDPTTFPVIIDLKSLNASFYKDWSTTADEYSAKFDLLLQRASMPRVNLTILDSIDPNVFRLIIADGLNEILAGFAEKIIATLNEYVRRAPQSGVVITDRLSRRALPDSDRWQLCTLMPIPEADARKYLIEHPKKLETFDRVPPRERQLLGTPFFLDQFLRSKQDSSVTFLTTSDDLYDFFHVQLGMKVEEIRRAAEAAFTVYKNQPTRTFSMDSYISVAGEEITTKLKDAGAIRVEVKQGIFSHHLEHDYLASFYLFQSKDLWTQENLDAVTLYASSFDVLSMTLEQLRVEKDADFFIRTLYDWNVYASGYALAEAYHSGRLTVSQPMQTIIVAMLAERKWDFIEATAQRAVDALSLFPEKSFPLLTLEAENMDQLFALVRGFDFNVPEFKSWVALFTKGRAEHVEAGDQEWLTKSDSIMGWTLANVLKRTMLDETEVTRIRNWIAANKDNETVLWRIVHVLGAYPSTENVKAVLEVFHRVELKWPRYGALRSLIEMAARSQNRDLASSIFGAFQREPEKLLVRGLDLEFARAIFVREAPPYWFDLVLPVLQNIYMTRTDENERVRWTMAAQRMKQRYAVAR